MMNKFIQKIDVYLFDLRRILTVPLFEKMEALFMVIAGFCTPISAIVGSLIVFVLAIKQDSLQIFLFAFLWIPLVVLCYYIAIKMKAACAKTLRNNPSSIANQEILDVFAVLGFVTALSSVAAGFFYAIKFSSIEIFLYAILFAILQVYSAWIVIQPSLIATSVRNASSGGLDLIAIFAMGSKIYLRMANLVIGVSAVVGLIFLFRSFYFVLFKPDEIVYGGIWSAIGFVTVLGGLLAPYVIYILFILGYLMLDVLRSILMMPKSEAGVVDQNFVKVEPVPVPVPVAVNDVATDSSNFPSPQFLKAFAFVLIILVFLALAMTKGKELYEDYQIKSEISRIEREQKIAEERKRIEVEQAELKRKNDYIENAKKFIGKQPIDLLLNDVINSEIYAIVGRLMPTVEMFFEQGQPVYLSDNLVMASACQKDFCDQYKGLLVVDLSELKSYVVLIRSDETSFVGILESELPAAVKKWLISNR
jgi:hypothetical protein